MAFNNEIEEVKAQLKVLEKKLALLEEVEKQPRMNLQQEGEYAVVSFNDKVYYRLQGDVTFSWYIKKGVNVGYPVPTLMMVNDAETERLLEGIYYNHIQVKKEKEQRTKTSVEEAFKDWWGQYPETGTWDGFDEKRWQGFQAGYEFAYQEKIMEKVQVVSSTKPQTLTDLIYDWWERVFGDTDDTETCIDNLVDEISLWLPTEHETNSYKWNECIRMIREKLR